MQLEGCNDSHISQRYRVIGWLLRVILWLNRMSTRHTGVQRGRRKVPILYICVVTKFIWDVEDEKNDMGIYADLKTNPEGYTGYQG